MEIQNPILKQIWQDRFCKDGESFDQNLERVAKHCSNDKNEEKEFLSVMQQGLFFPAGRTMSNAGIGTNLSVNNCYVFGFVPDSIEGIFDAVKTGALTHKSGGGIGYSFDMIRPNGMPTSNDATASGVVSFMKVFDTQTATILQGGRRGANMGVLSIYHPDIYEYLECKSWDENAMTHFNLSVMVDDAFMRAQQKDVSITLHWPVYDEKGLIITDESKWKITKVIKARELWDMIMTKAYNTGEYGVLFYDNMNKDNPTSYMENIVCTNPCVTGDTLILTNKGYEEIESLAYQETIIWNGYEWSKVIPKVTGIDQKVLEIKFSDGNSLKCTPYHKFILKDEIPKEAQELVLGDKLVKHTFPILEGKIYLPEKYDYTLGFFAGDGCCINENANSNIIPLYGEKQKLIPYFEYDKILDQSDGQNRLTLVLPKNRIYKKDFVPSLEYRISSRLNWLAGVIDSDGTLLSSDGGIGISSINREFLMNIKYLLNTLGCTGTVSLNRESAFRELPDGKGGYKLYECQNCYRLVISSSNVKKLMDYGLKTFRVPLIASPNRDASRFITITEIIDIDEEVDKVYCFNEPKNHTGIFNGVITGQCAEFVSGVLYGSNIENSDNYKGACNLGSLFIHNFIKNPFMRDAYIDYDLLEEVIPIAVKLLDNIIDINNFPLKFYENYQLNMRAIGLGISGLADAFTMLGVKYGSPNSVFIANELMNFISYNAYLASYNLALIKGAFPYCDNKAYSENNYLKKHVLSNGSSRVSSDDWDLLIHRIAKDGIRNSRLLSIAPTGTLSLCFGNNCSSGLEPIFALEYDRKVKIGGQDESDIQVVTMMDNAYRIWKEELPFNDVNEDVFVTAQTLNVDDHLSILSTLAFHVDMSISKTINLPTEYSFEDTKAVYDKVWSLGIKGCTIFRPNELRQGILIAPTEKTEEDLLKEDDEEDIDGMSALPWGTTLNISDDLIGKKTKVMTGCGSLHVSAWYDPDNGKLMELFLSKGSEGGCNSFMTALSRMTSTALRTGVDVNYALDQLNSCPSCTSYCVRSATKKDTSKGRSCPSAIAFALKSFQKEIENELEIDFEDNRSYSIMPTTNKITNKETENKVVIYSSPDEEKEYLLNYGEVAFAKKYYKCPNCSEKLSNLEGCLSCIACGFTKCG